MEAFLVKKKAESSSSKPFVSEHSGFSDVDTDPTSTPVTALLATYIHEGIGGHGSQSSSSGNVSLKPCEKFGNPLGKCCQSFFL